MNLIILILPCISGLTQEIAQVRIKNLANDDREGSLSEYI